MTAFVFFTVLTVSIDSFVCGFSLSLSKGKTFLIAPIIALTVFIMCVFTNYLTLAFQDVLTETTASLSGIILILVGVFNLIKKDEKTSPSNASIVRQSLLSGFAVGMDGALGNLSLALMGYNSIWIPISIALTHGIMISLGILLSRIKFVQKFAAVSAFAPLVLIGLGAYKLLGFFI